MVAFDGGSGGTKKGTGTMETGEVERSIAAVVARCGIGLLVAGVVFFIDDDKTQVVEGKEDGGTGTQKELVAVGTLLEGALPHFGTFARIETGMVDADSGSEEASEPIDDLGGERNFGEQEKHLLTARKDIVDETDIDFGFAAGGDAVKERHRLLGIRDELVSLLLFATQFDGEGRDGLM